MPTQPVAPPPTSSHLFALWQAEAVRLREVRDGPLADRAACLAARRTADGLPARILARAAVLAQASGLQAQLRRWWRGARWVLAAMAAGACLTGAGMATGLLGTPTGAVNLGHALLALLGLHTLTFVLWLASLVPGLGSGAGSTLSRAWLWLTRRFARGADQALAAQALVTLLGRLRAWKSAAGLVSHALWSLAFLVAWLTLTLLLSTQHHSFHWETTLLQARHFTWLTQVLGSVPAALGVDLPDAADVAAALSGQPGSALGQARWSRWLLACVLVWGLAPRLLALLGCAAHLGLRLHSAQPDPRLPGWLELRARLQPTHAPLGVDGPAGLARAAARSPATPGTAHRAARAVLAHELDADVPWPPPGLPTAVLDLGRADSRVARNRVREALQPPPEHLLVVCNGRLTPDRGTARWLQELTHSGTELRVLVHNASDARRASWDALLADLNLPTVARWQDWLAHTDPHRA